MKTSEGIMPTIVGRMMLVKVSNGSEAAMVGDAAPTMAFVSKLALGMGYKYDQHMPYAAATDGTTLIEGPSFAEKPDQSYMRATVIHECLHIGLKHTRPGVIPPHFNRSAAMAAMDYSIHAIMHAVGLPIMDGLLYDEKYGTDMSWIDIYHDLMDRANSDGQDGNTNSQGTGGSGGGTGVQDDEGGDSQDSGGGQGDSQDDEGGDSVDDPILQGLADALGMSAQDIEDCIASHDKWKDDPQDGDDHNGDTDAIDALIRAAAQAAASVPGKLPGDLQVIVDKLAGPAKADWRSILQQILSEARDGDSDYDWTRMDPRQSAMAGYFVPRDKGGINNAVFAVDTSGSMSEDIKELWPEIVGMVTTAGSIENLHIILADCSVSSHTTLHNVTGVCDLPPIVADSGYGGTDFGPVMERVREIDWEEPVDIVLYFTDLDVLSFPEAPGDMPVVWLTFSNRDAPYGRVVRLTNGGVS